MERLKEPNPLREAGMYQNYERTDWKVKNLNSSQITQLPYQLRLKYKNIVERAEKPPGQLIFKASEPSSLEEMQHYVQYLFNRAPRPEFLQEFRDQNSMQFFSDIECGNLQEVYKISNAEYYLYLRSDTNTIGHTQWFYFRVENNIFTKRIKFKICNIRKATYMYRKGMKPWFRSEKTNNEWAPIEDEVEYFINSTWTQRTYSLSFTYNFESTFDTVFFAFGNPYSYSQLNSTLSGLDVTQIYFVQDELCRSMGGLPVPKIVISSKKQGLPWHKRKAVVLAGRVHPGEVNSSYVIEGALKFIASGHKTAQTLRENYIFYIIPMLNPDGVVCGNSRCGLIGTDLNRRWDNPDHLTHPTIFHLKRLISEIQRKNEILMFCDFHAHSKKKNAFIYGCNQAANEGFTSWTKVRLFPRILASLSPYFSFPNCKFRVEQCKMGTGRIVVWKEFNITNSFTLETSAYCYKSDNTNNLFYPQQLNEVGSLVMLGLNSYHFAMKSLEMELRVNGGWLKPNRLIELSGNPSRNIEDRKDSITRNVYPWREVFKEEELENYEENAEDSESSGSDSSPSDDNLDEEIELVRPYAPPPIKKKYFNFQRAVYKPPRPTPKPRFDLSQQPLITIDFEASYFPGKTKHRGRVFRKYFNYPHKASEKPQLLNPLVITPIIKERSASRGRMQQKTPNDLKFFTLNGFSSNDP